MYHELAKCPFCGKEPRMVKVQQYYHKIECCCGNGTRAYADKNEAVGRWNRRV